MHTESLAHKILSPEFDGKRFAIGKNSETLKVQALAPLSGIIDDSSRDAEKWNGIPLLHSSNLLPGCGVINCATSIAPISAERRVRGVLPKAVFISFDRLQAAIPEKMQPAPFVSEMNEDWLKHNSEWKKLRKALVDTESKKVLDDLVKFRMTGSYRHMSEYRVRLRDQYFDKVVSLNEEEVFVDCGGFDGDTTEQFIKRCLKYKHVWFFEPSKKNMEKAKLRLGKQRHINFIQKGVSDRIEQLKFSSESGSASAVSENGDSIINMTTIDFEIPESVTFVKMDLEGWELKALEGARDHIRKYRPKMAIAVYHQASDFRNIPRLILSFRSDYSVYLRHYTEGWSETVMYFIPA